MSKLNIEKLKELQEQMQWEDKHDNDIQASPRFWVVMDYRWEAVWEENAEKSMIYIPEYAESYDIDELLEMEKENESILYAALDGINEVECDITALEWVQEWLDEDAYLVPVALEEFIVPDTLFLTKKDAREHIKKNKHHYSSKAHTYAMTGWRSKSYDLVWNMLMNIDWNKYDNS